MKILWSILFVVVVGFVYISCKAPVASLNPTTSQPLAPQVAKASWEEEWNKIIQLARKEGRVVVYSSGGAGIRNALTPAFKGKYGVELEFIAGRPEEINERILREHNVRLYLVDVLLGGPGPTIDQLKPGGVLDSMEPVLILPEVIDPEKWWKGKLPWLDKDKTIFSSMAFPTPAFVINTKLANAGEFKSWRDLLNPKWKGKISIQDPTVGGAGRAWFSVVGPIIMGYDFMRELARQEPVIIRNPRTQVEWLSHEKQVIAVAPKSDTVVEFIEAGVPLKFIIPKEGTGLAAGGGGLSLIKEAPHPAAARLFINWFLSKEGLSLFSQAHGAESGRIDIPVDFISKEMRREPDVNYYPQDEEHYKRSQEFYQTAREIFGFLIK